MSKHIGHFFKHTFGGIFSSLLSIAGLVTGMNFLTIIGLGVSLLSGSSKPKLNMKLEDDATGHLVNTKRAGDFIPVVYGHTRIGGNVIFLHSQGSNNKELYMVVGLCMAGGQGKDIVKVNSLYFDGEPMSILKLKSKSSNTWQYEVKDEVTTINFTVNGDYIEHYSCDGDYEFCVDWDATRRFNINVTLNNGESKDNAYFSSEFNNSILTITAKSGKNIKKVSLVKFKTTGNWQSNMENLFDWIYFDGKNWRKFNKDEGEWEVDSSVKVDDEWQGEPSAIKKVLIDNGFKTPANIAFVGVKLIYDQKKWQKIPTITADLIRQNIDGSYDWTVAECIYDFLTNKEYGLAIPEEKIDSDSYNQIWVYCNDNQYFFNGAIVEGRASEILKNLCEHIRGDIIYLDGKFNFKVRDMRFSLYDPVYPVTITEENIVENSFKFSQADFSTIPNRAKVKFFNPSLDYKVDTFEMVFPGTENEDARYIECRLWGYDKSKAKYFAAYYLERARLADNISFAVTHEFIDLKINDLVKLSYKPFGIEEQYIRITALSPTLDGLLQVAAVLEAPELYNKDMDLDIYNLDLTNLPDPYDIPPEVENIIILENYIKQPDNTLAKSVLITWDYDNPWVEQFEVFVKSPDDTEYKFYGITSENFIEVITPDFGEYGFKIRPVSIYGSKDVVDNIAQTTFNTKHSVLGTRVIVFSDKIYTSKAEETFAPVRGVFTANMADVYIGNSGAIYSKKMLIDMHTELIKTNGQGFYQFSKAGDNTIYKLFPCETKELIFDLNNNTTDEYSCGFYVNATQSRAGIAKVVYNSSGLISDLRISDYFEAGGQEYDIGYGLSTPSFENCVADISIVKQSKSHAIFILYSDTSKEIWIAEGYDTSTFRQVPGSVDIYNLNFTDRFPGVAIIDDYRYIYIKPDGILYEYYYNFSNSSDPANDTTKAIITLNEAISDFYIEDYVLESNNLILIVRRKNNDEVYKVVIAIDDEYKYSLVSFDNKIDLLDTI